MPEATVTLTPYLSCRNAAEAIDFYQKAFLAEPVLVLPMKDGGIMHATLSISGATFYLTEECTERDGPSPLSLGGTPVTLHLQVPNCDEVFQRAVAAGCEVKMPLEDQFWGDRYGLVRDPYGHNWGIATTVRQVTMDDLNQAVAAMA